MSKPEDPTQIAEAPGKGIQQTKDPVPMSTPPAPYEPDQNRGHSLVSNEAKKETAEIKTAMAEPTTKQQTWVERMEGTKRAYNENNEESKGKNLLNNQPAVTSVTTDKTQPPKVEPKAGGFVQQLQETTKPPTPTKPTGPKK